jgi:CheY-like chemotaxis protein
MAEGVVKMQKILVIDDSKTVQLVARAILEPSGYSVISVVDPEEAPEVVRSEHPDLILMDLEMSLSGGALMESMREEGILDSTKVVLHSSRPSTELENAARQLNADGFIQKTSDRDEFLRRIESFFTPSR